MPELPEVETIKSQLSSIVPMEIVSIKNSDVISGIAHTSLVKLKKNTIHNIWRKGKMLIFDLNDGHKLLSHLGMTGSWRISDSPLKIKHNHLQIRGMVNNQTKYISYIDPRRFGHMYLYDQESAEKKLAELGTDLADKEFTVKYLKNNLLKYPNRMLKVSLLDQSLFAGTGNYIASEVCAHAGILPSRLVRNIQSKEFEKIFNAIKLVISGAVNQGGTTFQGGYYDANGEKGNGVNSLIVFYQKTCRLCHKAPIIKTILAQRGTYHCPKCQK